MFKSEFYYLFLQGKIKRFKIFCNWLNFSRLKAVFRDSF